MLAQNRWRSASTWPYGEPREEIMGVLRRDRFWSALLAAVVSTSAWGQTPGPAAGPAAVAPAAVPDFSGMWVHPYFPGFEPPASGPGPVLSKWRRPDGGSITRQLIGDYTNPILKPQAAEKVKMKGDIELAGGTFPTPSNQCWPSGVPYIFFQVGMQMLQGPDRITGPTGPLPWPTCSARPTARLCT
jgi:hypothetical protein